MSNNFADPPIPDPDEPPPPNDEADCGTTNPKADGKPDTEALPPEFADDALALAFSSSYGPASRYVSQWGRWYLWDGQCWRQDDTLRVRDMARLLCRSYAANAPQKVQKAVTSRKTIDAVLHLAQSDRRHAATVDQWDADPWLLNTTGGVVDLRTGETLPHDPDLHMTKMTAAAPGGDCRLWLAFLDRITEGNQDLVDFLQRAAGYMLTGSIRDHALFFCYGTGGNGKGVFLNTLTAILCDYATVATMATFAASKNEQHTTDLAMLQGARLVTAQETEEGRPWAEARIKALTGGDPITARFMHKDNFTYVPQFKLFIAGNHKPSLRNVDDAIRRRMHLIPFNAQITAEERDPDLPEKLRGEWPGILAWMIQGGVDWHRDGLAPPDIVRTATDDYMAAEDALGNWIAECCKPIGYGCTETARLFRDWTQWAKAAGENPGTMKGFRQNLEKRGYRPTNDPTSRRSAFQGIALNDVQRPRTEASRDWDC